MKEKARQKEKKTNILIVDDKPENIYAMEKVLNNLNTNIHTAQSGDEALALMLTHEFAVVLIDVKMPEMDGFEMAEIMRSNDSTKFTPIIFITALNKDKDFVFRGYEIGAVDYLFKPVDNIVLKSKVSVFVDLYSRKIEIENANVLLKQEMSERKRIEKELRRYREQLETIIEERTVELRESEERLSSFMNSATENFSIYDSKLNLVDINKAGLSMWTDGIQKEDLIGKNIEELAPNLSENGTVDEYFDVVMTGKPLYFENNVSQVNSLGRLFEVRAFKVGDGLGLITADITRRKNAEEELKVSLAEKELLLKEVHHRVKNNMQVISSILGLQIMHMKDEDDKKMIETSRNRICSMSLIHEKLYCSKDISRVDFRDLIQIVLAERINMYKAGRKKIKSTIKVEEIFLGIDKAIPCALIINELITNAVKYAFPNKDDGEIRVYFSKDTKGEHTLVIEDNGIGLPKDVDYYNTDTLGLDIVNNLVKQINGSIMFHSNGGSKITISFIDTEKQVSGANLPEKDVSEESNYARS